MNAIDRNLQVDFRLDVNDYANDTEKTFYREFRDAVLAGPDAGQEHIAACNSLTDGLLESPQFHKLLHLAATSSSAVAGAAFQDLIGKVMRKAAEDYADGELDRITK